MSDESRRRFHRRDPQLQQRRAEARSRYSVERCPGCRRRGNYLRKPKEYCSACAEMVFRTYGFLVPVGHEPNVGDRCREWITYRGRLKWDDTYIGPWLASDLHRIACYANRG